MPTPSFARIARWLDYAEKQAENEANPPELRQRYRSKAAHFRKVLSGHCSRCGRPIHDPESLRTGVGSECRRQLVAS